MILPTDSKTHKSPDINKDTKSQGAELHKDLVEETRSIKYS